jgi:hypothetical protein
MTRRRFAAIVAVLALAAGVAGFLTGLLGGDRPVVERKPLLPLVEDLYGGAL